MGIEGRIWFALLTDLFQIGAKIGPHPSVSFYLSQKAYIGLHVLGTCQSQPSASRQVAMVSHSLLCGWYIYKPIHESLPK
jgi:hypothetical protein